jgi:hypothetical protein
MAGQDSSRSFAVMTRHDLERLYKKTGEAHRLFSARRPDLRGQLVAGFLGQGAAAHYVDGITGIKDLDLWLLYDGRALTKGMPNRTIHALDFGPSVHGRHPDDDPIRFSGRRIDAMARSVSDHIEDPEAAVRAWLASGTTSARLLTTRPVILVWPRRVFSQIIMN